MADGSRRRLIRGVLSLSVPIPIAGCASLGPNSPTRLRELYVVNERQTSQQVRIRVTVDGTTEYETTFELPTDSTEQVSCEWPTEARSYTIAIANQSANWSTMTLDSGENECITAEFLEDTNRFAFGSFTPCPTSIGETCG